MRRASTRVSDSPSSSVCDQTIAKRRNQARMMEAGVVVEGASKDTASLQLTSKVPSAWTLEILPGYFLLRPLRNDQ